MNIGPPKVILNTIIVSATGGFSQKVGKLRAISKNITPDSYSCKKVLLKNPFY